MPARLQSKVTIVTGAASGIGESSARLFAAEGAILYLADKDAEALNSLSTELEEAGDAGRVVPIVCDVSDEAQVRALVGRCQTDYGRLDAAFNNAGMEGGLTTLDEFESSDFDRCLAVNLRGVFLCMKHQIALMKKAGSGSIVNMSSVMGLHSSNGLAAYSASKHGVIGLTKTAALENAEHGIRVNALCPGGVETRMVKDILETTPEVLEGVLASVPMKRLAKPSEIAKAALWLLSEDSSFVTGSNLIIDGGYCAI